MEAGTVAAAVLLESVLALLTRQVRPNQEACSLNRIRQISWLRRRRGPIPSSARIWSIRRAQELHTAPFRARRSSPLLRPTFCRPCLN